MYLQKKNVSLSKIKRKKISENLIKGKDSTQEPENPSKRAKEDGIIDEKHNNKKHLHHLKIKLTSGVILMRRHVNMMILQVIMMLVQEIWVMDIKIKKMKYKLKLHLKKMIVLHQKLVKG